MRPLAAEMQGAAGWPGRLPSRKGEQDGGPGQDSDGPLLEARPPWPLRFAGEGLLGNRSGRQRHARPVAGWVTPPRSAPGSTLPQKFSNPRGRRRLFGIDSQRRNSSRSWWLALSSS